MVQRSLHCGLLQLATFALLLLCNCQLLCCCCYYCFKCNHATTEPHQKRPGQVRVIKLMRSLLLKSFVCCGQLPSGFATDSPLPPFPNSPSCILSTLTKLFLPLLLFIFLFGAISFISPKPLRRYPLHSYYLTPLSPSLPIFLSISSSHPYTSFLCI